LLSFCAFWAGGNLMPDPDGDQVVPTPAGLAANGICQVLLMCALHKGGTRKLKERYEHYFNLGVEVMTGKNNWEKDIVETEIKNKGDDLSEKAGLEDDYKDKSGNDIAETLGAEDRHRRRWFGFRPAKKVEKDETPAKATIPVKKPSLWKRWKPGE